MDEKAREEEEDEEMEVEQKGEEEKREERGRTGGGRGEMDERCRRRCLAVIALIQAGIQGRDLEIRHLASCIKLTVEATLAAAAPQFCLRFHIQSSS